MEKKSSDLEFVSIYVTFANEEEAKSIGRILVEERLVACCNIIPNLVSIYHWKDRLEESQETLVFFKTTKDRAAKTTKKIQELHSYEVPCILILPILEGNQPYLDWIRNSL